MLEYNKCDRKTIILNMMSSIVVNMIVLFLSTKIFKNIYIENIFYLFVVSVLLMIFNKILKPILNIIMLPLNLFTMGISYPLTNILILKLISLIMVGHFVLEGWFSLFFISIFVSIMTFIIDLFIGREIRSVRL